MKKLDVVRVWGRILRGHTPFLSLEITKECPLRCPGCYAYTPEHLGEAGPLRQLSDYRGGELVTAAVAAVRRYRPVHVSIIGGEPLVRYRELSDLLPRLDRMGVEVQLVTSAVRPIPLEWRALRSLHLVVSVDGLPSEHDRRRAPATYERILKNIEGHSVTVHCTVTSEMMARPGYLADFCRFWSERPEARKIWFSAYTPQEGEESPERLTREERKAAIDDMEAVAAAFPKVHLPREMLAGYRNPPLSPAECTFARVTACLTPDMETRVSPCQLGGRPVCGECGCIASVGMNTVAHVKLGGVLPLSAILNASIRVGARNAPAPVPAKVEIA